jgi:acetolactate synthase I/II/III large subunit
VNGRESVTPENGLKGLLPEDHRLLASCFDAHQTIGGGLFAVGDVVEEVDRVSSTGLDMSGGLLYRCLWSAEGDPAELVVYDALGVRRYHRLDDVSTPHDILVGDEGVLVAATTQNEVRCVAPDGSTAWRWRAPGETDSWHLNSLVRYHGRAAVCGFGQFLRRRGWDENGKPASGRVVCLGTGEPLLEGLRAPHNPWYADGTWLVCDSASGEILEIPDGTRQVSRRLALPGWPRGLVVTDRWIFVGLSPHRHAATSVETAAVAAVDRAEWRMTALVELPAREVYALAMAPASLVDGARTGFGTNRTRTHEQGQRQLFEQLGRRPVRLWAISDPLPESGRRAAVTLDAPVDDTVEADSLLTLACSVRNTGTELLTPAPPFPVRVVHGWYGEDGDAVETQAIRAALPRSLPPEDVVRVTVRARVPSVPGRYHLRVTLAQDPGTPFAESGALEVPIRVVSERGDHAALAAFGLSPAEVKAARASGPMAEDMVRALVRHPSGEPRGRVLGSIEALGRPMFATALAETLECSPESLEHTVRSVLDGIGDALLTSAEAVALVLRSAGVHTVFGSTDAEGSALGAALAGPGPWAVGADARQCLLLAGGAGRFRPGRAAAVLGTARVLSGALGALADLRQSGAGGLALVEVPPAPAHLAADLVTAAGRFTKSCHACPAPPEEPEGRRAAVDAFVAALRDAVRDSLEPSAGLVLLTLPEEAARTAWIPLPALEGALPTGTATTEVPQDAPGAAEDRGPAAPGGRADVRETLMAAMAAAAGRAVLLESGGVFGPPPTANPGDRELPGGVLVAEGYGVAQATGLALADPSLTVVCCLDAEEFTGELRDLMPAVRASVPITLVVCTGVSGGDSPDAPAPRAHCAAAADALGVRSRRVAMGDPSHPARYDESLDVLRSALTSAVAHPGPALVEVVLPACRDRRTGAPARDRSGEATAPTPLMAGAAHA